jgi:hypothetical protein
MRNLRFLILGMCIALNGLTVFAADKNVGTSGAAFLKIGAGARPTAMGNSFVAVADDVNAVYFNPAGLSTLDQPEITAMHTQWIQDMNYDFGAFVYPTESGAFALSAATLKTSDLERRNSDESFQGNFDNLDSAYALSFSRNINATFSMGLTTRLIRQKIDSTSADALSGDIGLLKRMEERPITWGLALRHFGQSIKFIDEGDPQPMTLDGGLSTDLLNKKLLLSLNVLKPRDNSVQFGLGSEWNHSLGEDTRCAFRFGYNSSSTDADGANGVSVGGGIGFKKLDLDFAWVPFGDLGNTFRYSALVKF